MCVLKKTSHYSMLLTPQACHQLCGHCVEGMQHDMRAHFTCFLTESLGVI